MNPPGLLLLGADGQLGWELRRALLPLGELVAVGRAQADLGDAPGLRAAAGLLGGSEEAFELSRVRLSAYRLLSGKPGARVDLRSASGYPL